MTVNMRFIDQIVFAGFVPWQAWFDPMSGHVGFVVGKAALERVFFCQAFQ
jgi:hypothetical protein